MGRSIASAVLLTAFLGWFAPPGLAQASRWSAEFGRPGVSHHHGHSRRVSHILEHDGKLVLGGWFTSAGGLRTRSLIGFDNGTWSQVATRPPILSENEVKALIVYQGSLVSGGYHGNTGGTHVTVVDANGQWQILGNALFNDPPTGQASIDGMVEWNGTLVVAGDFAGVDGTTAIGVAQWDGATWTPLGTNEFLPSAHDPVVLGGELYVVGQRDPLVHTDTAAVFRWDGASWIQHGAAVEYFYSWNHLTVYGGQLILNSTSSDLQVLYNAWSRYTATGWRPMTGSPFSSPQSVQRHGGLLWVTGAGAANGGSIATWNGTTWSTPEAAPENIHRLAWIDGTRYAVGSFQEYDGVALGCVAKEVGGQWVPLDSGIGVEVAWPETDGTMFSLPDHLVLGDHVALDTGPFFPWPTWDGTGWDDISPLLPGGYYNLQQLIWFDGKEASASERNLTGLGQTTTVALYDRPLGGPAPSIGEFLDGNGNPADVHALLDRGGELVVVGDFATVDGSPLAHVAAWDGLGWNPIPTDPGFAPTAAVVWDGKVVIGSAGDLPVVEAPGAWSALPAPPYPVTGVHTMEVFQGDLVVSFDTDPNIWLDAGPLLRWDGATWTPLATEISDRVRDMVVFEDELYLGGEFFEIDGATFNKVARWNGQAWQALGEGIEPDHYPANVTAMAEFDGDLYMVGDFVRAGGVPSYRFARWKAAATAAPPIASVATVVLERIVPNPANPRATIEFRLEEAGHVRVVIHDVRGRVVWRRDLGSKVVGSYAVTWDGTDRAGRSVASGVYHVEVRGRGVARGRVALVR